MGRLPALRWTIAAAAVAASLDGCHVPFISKGGSASEASSAWNSISTAQGQGKTIITEAQALAATAQSLASQHGC